MSKVSKEYMEKLAEMLDLTFDGGDKETRLFLNNNYAETLNLNKKEYEAMEKLLEKTCVKGKGFEVYAWNDASGYEYWNKKYKENNYIQITVDIKNENVSVKELDAAISEVEETFSKYMPDYYHESRNVKIPNQEIIKQRLGII